MTESTKAWRIQAEEVKEAARRIYCAKMAKHKSPYNNIVHWAADNALRLLFDNTLGRITVKGEGGKSKKLFENSDVHVSVLHPFVEYAVEKAIRASPREKSVITGMKFLQLIGVNSDAVEPALFLRAVYKKRMYEHQKKYGTLTTPYSSMNGVTVDELCRSVDPSELKEYTAFCNEWSDSDAHYCGREYGQRLTKEEIASLINESDATLKKPYINGLGMQFVSVPGTDVHFSIWQTRLGDFRSFVRETGYNRSQQHDPWEETGFPQSDNHPVVSVSKKDAMTFCNWLSQKEGKHYRLPTDEEWSIAAGVPPKIGAWSIAGGVPPEILATKTTFDEQVRWTKARNAEPVYPWGIQWPPPRGVGNYAQSLGTDDYEYTSPVGIFPANKHGIYDMGGNVWEFSSDYWNYRSFRDYDHKDKYLPVAWILGLLDNDKSDVLRGGSWISKESRPLDLRYRCRNRSIMEIDRYSRDIGFRCVVEL